MPIILFLVLAATIALLWQRVARLERQVAEWRDQGFGALPATRSAQRESRGHQVFAAPGPPAAAVPEQVIVGNGNSAQRTWPPRFDFEDLFGRLLPIWAGGITLAVAGFFLVRWSIDAGLLTPPVRVLLAGLFGLALIAGAEAAYRWRDRVADPRVAQALAGAGLATLYAAFYLAGSTYGLIGSTVAFLGLAGVTAAAIGLSYRFGLPSAVLGLVGGFAAPALVGSEQANLPLLVLYLALVTIGLTLTARRQSRAWLGLAALAAGLGWGSVLTGQGLAGSTDVAVLGVYLVLLGAVVPALTGRAEAQAASAIGRLVRLGAAALAAGQLAVIVSGQFGGLEWSLYLLLGGALAWFGWREPAMREAGAVAAAIGTALLGLWGAPPPLVFFLVSAGLTLLFAGVPLGHLARRTGRALDIAQSSAVAIGVGLAALWQFGTLLPDAPRPVLGLALLALAAFPAAAAVLGRRSAAHERTWIAAAEAAAAVLVLGAAAQVLPRDALAWAGALGAAGLAWRVRSLTGAIAALAAVTALWAAEPLVEWLRAGSYALVGTPLEVGDLPPVRAVLLALAPAALALAAAGRASGTDAARRVAGGLAVVVAAIAGHILYRHLFAAAAGGDFVTTGVAQRAIWEALLLGAAWLAWRRTWARVAFGLALAAVAHLAWFSLILHNPLWSAQAVGALPLANMLVPAYAAAMAMLFALRRWSAGAPALVGGAIDGAAMLVIALFALSELRQAFAGSLLAARPIAPSEDLLRSLLGIVLAVGFLAWGARTGMRSWRIGSLVLMVVAVLKVFLVDAAGLAGLARIASFMALGFSLIGIGWFYARQLRAPAALGGAAVSQA